MPGRRRALLVRNPRAREAEAAAAGALDRLRAGGVELTPLAVDDPADLPGALAAQSSGHDAIVVAGGDGTLNAAAPGLLAAGLPLGILPLGTANDLARTLALPTDPVAAAAVVVAGRTRRIDVATVNERPFFNVASLGLSVRLAQALTAETKQRFGRLGYAVAALRAVWRVRPFRASIESDEASVRVRTLQIAVGNGRFYGGGNIVAVAAAIDDGVLDLYSLELDSPWLLAPMLPWFRRGAHGAWPQVRVMKGHVFEVRTRRPRLINADGELLTRTPARFAVRPRALEVFVGEPAHG